MRPSTTHCRSFARGKHAGEHLTPQRIPVLLRFCLFVDLLSLERKENMDIVHHCCAGIDVHKKTIVICVLTSPTTGSPTRVLRTFSTLPPDLQRARDWLISQQVTHVAMESTGVYWKPIYEVLEGCMELLLVNAQHIKALPGRKTDLKDAEWIAQLLQHGLLRPSFVPDLWQRHLRELTRSRTRLVQERARFIQRIHKVLEEAHCKLASVVSDLMGVSAQAILQALLAG